MFKLIFEREWIESCYGGSSMDGDMRYHITESNYYPMDDYREQGEGGDDEMAGWTCASRKLLGEFETREEAVGFLLKHEEGYWLGDEIRKTLAKYPEQNCLPRFYYAGLKDRDGNSIGRYNIGESSVVIVANNSESPFWFSSEEESDKFVNAICSRDLEAVN